MAHGSLFCFDYRAVQDNKMVASGELASASMQSQGSPPCRILVVDDDIDIRYVAAKVLKRSGFEVDAAEDGAVAWDNLQQKTYHLLITDHDMPKVTGVELVKKVRAARMALPVILVSGAMPTEELDRHPWLQFAATLPKPFSIEQLLGTVKEVLRATNGVRGQFDSPPDGQSRASADGIRPDDSNSGPAYG